MKTTVKKIFSIEVEQLSDNDPDVSWIGEYTDKLEEGVIVRAFDEFYENLQEDDEIPERSREYRGFKPYAGGEKVGTADYHKYGMQDYLRMEQLEKGNWCFIGIKAKAKVGVSFNGGKNWKLDTLTSGGLWGIKSDSDKSEIESEEQNQLSDLVDILKAYGFSPAQIRKAKAA